MTDTIRYTQADNSQVLIEPQDYSVPQPCNTWHQEIIDEWIAEGNTISPYYEYYDWTIAQAQSVQISNINRYGNVLVETAYDNPTQELQDIDGHRYKDKVNIRSRNKSDKLAGEILLTQDEKDESKTDQKLAEYEVKIGDDSDKAITNMCKLSTVDEIMAFDIPSESWNVWIPPI